MKCPTCASAELIHDTRDIPHTYKGETTVIPNVTGDFCPACGESVLELAEASLVSSVMREFRKQQNHEKKEESTTMKALDQHKNKPDELDDDEFDDNEYDELAMLERLETLREDMEDLGINNLPELIERIEELHRHLDNK